MKKLGSWGVIPSYQLGGTIGCGLALIGLLAGGWAPLAAIGIALVTGAVAGWFISTLDAAARDIENAMSEPKKKPSPAQNAAKAGTDFMKTNAGKAMTGVAVVALASSIALSGNGGNENQPLGVNNPQDVQSAEQGSLEIEGPSIEYGGTVQGELSTSSDNTMRASWSFRGDKGDIVNIRARVTDDVALFEPVIFLYDSDGDKISESVSVYGGTQHTIKDFKLPARDVYKIEVAWQGQVGSGTFELSLDKTN